MANYIISKKWTGRKDAFLTLWRPNNSGYCFSDELAGKYTDEKIASNKEYYHHPLNLVIDETIIKPLLTPVFYENRHLNIIPNTAKNRKLLGIKAKELDKDYASCPHINKLKKYLIDSKSP